VIEWRHSVLDALATLYVAIKYREVRKFLAGAFFVSSGTCWYLWMTGVSLPIVLPYTGTVSVETPEISGQRAIVGAPGIDDRVPPDVIAVAHRLIE